MTEEEKVVEETTEEVESTEEATEESRDWEAEARAQGWKPQDEWKGDPPKGGFKDAKTFVEVGEEVAGYKIKSLEKRLEEVEKRNKKQLQAVISAHKKKLDQLKAERAKAIEDGDGQRFTRIEEDIAATQGEIDAAGQEINSPSPIESEWVQRNATWWGVNPRMTRYARAFADEVQANGAPMTEAEFYAALDAEMRDAFPSEMGANPNRSRPSKSESATPPQKEKGSLGKLAPNERAEVERGFKEMQREFGDVGMTLEEYAREWVNT